MRKVFLLPSVFEGRPPVLLFRYTKACGAKQRPMERAVAVEADDARPSYCHADAVHQYNAVVNVLGLAGLSRAQPGSGGWSLLWAGQPSPEALRALGPRQRANHFRGSWHLARKDLIWRSLSRMQRRFGQDYRVMPQSFVLPGSAASWACARTRQPDALWIWKPCGQSCGRGIKVLRPSMTEEEAKALGRKSGVVQRYVENPLLIDGYKFDLRIYVVVLSYDPLKVYINDEGLVRFATEKYSLAPEALQRRTVHLTNYSVNKASPHFVQNMDWRAEAGGAAGGTAAGRPRASKWSLGELRAHFGRRGLDYEATFRRVRDLVVKTLIAVEAPMRSEWCKALGGRLEQGWDAQGAAGAHRASCFEVYGFDVLVDSGLKPWLLEVNVCPSLSSSSPLDKRIKTKLVADALTLVGIRPPAQADGAEGGERGRAGADRRRCPRRAAEGDAAERVARLAACSSPHEALALFDGAAWELVLEAHDEDMRRGGLERIFPTAESARYAPFFERVSYCNLVLEKWHEAGGVALLSDCESCGLPPYVPRQVSFSRA